MLKNYATTDSLNNYATTTTLNNTVLNYYTKTEANQNYVSKSNLTNEIANLGVGDVYSKTNTATISTTMAWVNLPAVTWTVPAGTWVIDFSFCDSVTGTGIWTFNLTGLGISDTIWKSSADYSCKHFNFVKTYSASATGNLNYYQAWSSTSRSISFSMNAVRIK